MILADLLNVMEHIAPTRYAEPWDNVGLLAGDPNQPLAKAILTIDYTPAVAEEAVETHCDLAIAYHPPIFEPLKRLIAPSPLFDSIRRGIAIYSPHTALDVADGGTNDMLADAIGISPDSRQPLRLTDAKAAANCKLIVFTPSDAVEKVSQAMFAAGAGHIGNYSRCSFRSPGTGTFFGEAGANPAIGQPGKLEQAQEERIETILPIEKVSPVIQAMRKAHPYEEPAFDLVQLAAPPEGKGQGRIGPLNPPVQRQAVIARIKQHLGLDRVLLAGPEDGLVRRAACCAGSCGDLLNDVLAQKADLYLTGEMRHHDALKAANCGMTVICALHSNSERPILARLAARLTEKLPQLQTHLSRRDRDPFSYA